MRTTKFRKRTAALSLSFAIAFSGISYGDEEPYMAVDGNQISEERLADGKIEYEELGSLVHANNLTIKEITDQMDRTISDYRSAQNTLRTERDAAKQDKEDAEDSGHMADYLENSMLEKIYSSAVGSYGRIIDKLNSESSEKSRRNIEKQLTNAAQSLMIAWQSIEAQKESVEIMTELYELSYEKEQLREAAGLSTSQDVLSAYNRMEDMKVTLSSMEISQDSIYRNLCQIIGIYGEEELEIAEIPGPDMEKTDAMDLGKDTETALDKNTELVSAKTSNPKNEDGGLDAKWRSIAAKEKQVRIKMEELYNNVMSAKTGYEAAVTGAESAEISWENTARKKELGMLSEEEYLREKLQYAGKKASLKAAELTLLQAMKDYEWAVNGIMTLEE